MTLLEEKKMVARWMGWKLTKGFDERSEKSCWHVHDKFKNWLFVNIENWNPQSERQFWDEIWDNMDEDFIISYLNNLHALLEVALNGAEHLEHFANHTAKPEICWQALIKALENS